MLRSLRIVAAFVPWLFAGVLAVAARAHAQASSDEPQIPDGYVFAVGDVIERAIAARAIPGCVVVVGTHDRVLLRRAWGARALVPAHEEMTVDTIFDLASLTKPIATATSIHLLSERGLLSLDDLATRFIPELANGTPRAITIRDLLMHASGLPGNGPMSDYDDGAELALSRALRTRARRRPGVEFRYSDAGYIVLGEIVRRVSGRPLDVFAREEIFIPLAMEETGFRPAAALRQRVAPTEVRNGTTEEHAMIRGVVHDPRAYRLGGVAGNAGIFSTADDLARFAQMMLGHGELDGRRVMSDATWASLTTAQPAVQGNIRTAGWDVQSSFSSNRPPTFGARAFGHGGFTGTAMWIDPELDRFVIFLSNRVHPSGGEGGIGELVAEVGALATVGSLVRDRDARPVRVGVDVLVRENFARLRGANVGLVTHTAGRSWMGARTVDLFRRAPGVHLRALFAPEHGLEASRDGVVATGFDTATGLRVYSLFGPNRAPTPAMLAGIDTLVVDLQDVGARFYTYISTLLRVIETAASRRLRILVLDRPNPIGGAIEGPLLDDDIRTFINFHSLPVRHGMTIGEIARLLDHERAVGSRVEVVAMEGWTRGTSWEATGLAWTPPSPALQTVDEARLYPAIGLLEGTNLSVGRGTDMPMEIVAAPWIDSAGLVRALADDELPGVEVSEVHLTPRASPYRDTACHGVRFTVLDPSRIEAVRTGLAIARALVRRHPAEWERENLVRLVGSARVVEALERGASLDELAAFAESTVDDFAARRAPFLLYP